MRKIASIIILSTILINSSIKQSHALIIDGSQIGAKVSQSVQAVNDTVNKVSQTINQAKQMATQGYNLGQVRGLFEKYAQNWIRTQLASAATNLVNVGGTNAKQLELKETKKQLYHDAMASVEEQKKQMIEDNLHTLKDLQSRVISSLGTKKQECADKKKAYEQAEDFDLRNKYLSEYGRCTAELKDLEGQETELATSIDDHNKSLQKVEEKASDIAAGKNKEDETRQEWIDAQVPDQYEIKGVETNAQDDWAKLETMEKFVLTDDDYKQFIGEYFYNPESLTGDKDTTPMNAQSQLDSVMRERRFLFVNTAVHLLQVSASVRRAVPLRKKTLDDMFVQTPEANGELEAMSAYASTRIENAKILLLYARLLSAKLQYLSARDLLNIEAERKSQTIGEGLGSYILQEEEIKDFVKKSNTTINTDMSKYTNPFWKNK